MSERGSTQSSGLVGLLLRHAVQPDLALASVLASVSGEAMPVVWELKSLLLRPTSDCSEKLTPAMQQSIYSVSEQTKQSHALCVVF